MSNDTTYIAGVGITRFDKQPAKSVKDLVRDAVTQALADAGCDAADLQAPARHPVTRKLVDSVLPLRPAELVPARAA